MLRFRIAAFLRLCLRLVCYTTNHTRDWGAGARAMPIPDVRVASQLMLVGMWFIPASIVVVLAGARPRIFWYVESIR